MQIAIKAIVSFKGTNRAYIYNFWRRWLHVL